MAEKERKPKVKKKEGAKKHPKEAHSTSVKKNVETKQLGPLPQKKLPEKKHPSEVAKESGLKISEKLFDKYEYAVDINDASLVNYISLKPIVVPHTFARHANKPFAKAEVNIVERLANKLMRGGTGDKIGGKVIRTEGRLQGKKTKVLKIVEKAFDIIFKKKKQNPLQLLINALENSAPLEDVTRVQFGGVRYQVAVDVSSQRRVDLALRNIALAAIQAAFKKRKTLTEALADEIIKASEGSADSFAIKRRDEIERMAKSAR